MDNFREWVSDNLRYILLVLAVILILAVAVVGVKAIQGVLSTDPVQEETETTSETETEAQSGSQETEPQAPTLETDDPTVLATVQAYYNARASKDIETLKTMVESLSDAEQQAILDNNVIESYNNIKVYSKPGIDTGSYVVYVYYEGKLNGIETLAPGLTGIYMKTREDGTLYIADKDSDEAVKAYVDEVSAQEDVQQLVADASAKLEAAKNADENLKAWFEENAVPETEVVYPDGEGVEANKVVMATDGCNVRADSREDAEIIGSLEIGETVTRVRKLDNGWTEIKYGEGVAYVSSEYLTEDVTTE